MATHHITKPENPPEKKGAPPLLSLPEKKLAFTLWLPSLPGDRSDFAIRRLCLNQRVVEATNANRDAVIIVGSSQNMQPGMVLPCVYDGVDWRYEGPSPRRPGKW